LNVALAYFNQAIGEDPRFAQAYSGVADTYALLGDWQYAVMTPKEALPKAKAAAVKALELDSSLGEATTPWHSALMASSGILKQPEKNSGEQRSHQR
jgi:tetratricopeptide (TPR) repeat protein